MLSTILTALEGAFESSILRIIHLSPPILVSTGTAIAMAVLYGKSLEKTSGRNLLGYIFCFGIFGASLGLMAGSAQEPLINKLLSPFLALFTSFIAYITKKETPGDLQAAAPGAIGTFLISIMFSYYYEFAP